MYHRPGLRALLAETFILIPGRTSRQGAALNEGKFTAADIEERGALLMCPDDINRRGA